MAYSNPTPPPMAPGPSTGNRIDIKPGPMPPTPQPSPTARWRVGRYDPEKIAAIMAARRAALSRLQPILGGGRGAPVNELPVPTTRGERGGGRFMDGRGRPGVSYPDYYGPSGPGGFPEGRGFPSHGDTGFMSPEQRDAFARFVRDSEAMPMPAQITPEMVQRWWNGGGQYGNPQSGGIIGAGLERRPDNRGVGLPPPMVPPREMPAPPEPPIQAMLPDQGMNQAPGRSQRPSRPQPPPAFSNVNDINNRYGVDAGNWYGNEGLTDFGRQGWAQLLAERFGQVGNVNDINNRFGVDASGWYGDNGAITDQGRQGWLNYMMSMNPYYGGF